MSPLDAEVHKDHSAGDRLAPEVNQAVCERADVGMKLYPEEYLERIKKRLDEGEVYYEAKEQKDGGKLAVVELRIRLKPNDMAVFAGLMKVRMD